MRRLLAQADAVMHNMRGDAAARLGVDYQTAKELNPEHRLSVRRLVRVDRAGRRLGAPSTPRRACCAARCFDRSACSAAPRRRCPAGRTTSAMPYSLRISATLQRGRRRTSPAPSPSPPRMSHGPACTGPADRPAASTSRPPCWPANLLPVLGGRHPLRGQARPARTRQRAAGYRRAQPAVPDGWRMAVPVHPDQARNGSSCGGDQPPSGSRIPATGRAGFRRRFNDQLVAELATALEARSAAEWEGLFARAGVAGVRADASTGDNYSCPTRKA